MSAHALDEAEKVEGGGPSSSSSDGESKESSTVGGEVNMQANNGTQPNPPVVTPTNATTSASESINGAVKGVIALTACTMLGNWILA